MLVSFLIPKDSNTPPSDKQQDKHRRRSASPRRSPSPPPRQHNEDADDDRQDFPLETLPTRNKSERSKHAMSFRVGGRDTDSPRPESERTDSRGRRSRGRSRERDDTSMDVEEEGEEEEDLDVVVEDEGFADMQALMGFGGFGTTKNKKVAGNDVGAVSKEKTTKYRQYMNRPKGFNRPLSPSR